MIGPADSGLVLFIGQIRVAVDQVVVPIEIFIGAVAEKCRPVAKIPVPAVFSVVIGKAGIQEQFLCCLVGAVECYGVNVGIIFSGIAVRAKLAR